MGFSRQEYWSGLPFPSAGDLPNPGIEPGTFALQVDSLLTELQGKPEFGLPSYHRLAAAIWIKMIHVILGHLMLTSQSSTPPLVPPM